MQSQENIWFIRKNTLHDRWYRKPSINYFSVKARNWHFRKLICIPWMVNHDEFSWQEPNFWNSTLKYENSIPWGQVEIFETVNVGDVNGFFFSWTQIRYWYKIYIPRENRHLDPKWSILTSFHTHYWVPHTIRH